MKKLLMALMVLGLFGSLAFAQAQEAPIVPDSIIVVFHGHTLPRDAAARVQRAGGEVVSSLKPMGVLLARPVSVDGATLIQNLRSDSAVLDADYDRVLEGIAPEDDGGEDDGGEVVTEWTDPLGTHPLPSFSSALPPDFLYNAHDFQGSPSTPQQWSVKRVGAMGGDIPCEIHNGIPIYCPGAWDVTKGEGAVIAILDTGVNPDHPDVKPNLLPNMLNEIPIDSASKCEVHSPIDQFGHGTWTASIAAGAAGPGTGLVVGVAPEAKILSVKVLQREPGTGSTFFTQCRNGSSRGSLFWLLQGIKDAHDNGADVISMSLSGLVQRSNQDPLDEQGAALWSAFNRVTNFVTANGSVLVAAAGNQATDLDNQTSFVRLPAESPNVIAVTATINPDFRPLDPRQPDCPLGTDCLAFYSNFGSSLHGLAAPGGTTAAPPLPEFGACTPSTATSCNATAAVRGACSSGLANTTIPLSGDTMLQPGKSFGCFNQARNHIWYAQATGTSAATAHVAGVAALVKAANPNLNAHQIRTILQTTAQQIGGVGYSQFLNFGLVDAAAAVRAAQTMGGLP